MEKESSWEVGGIVSLSSPEESPPNSCISPKVKMQDLESRMYSVMTRPGFGNSGRLISLLSNHFKASINSPDVVFYQYTVSLNTVLFLGSNSKNKTHKYL